MNLTVNCGENAFLKRFTLFIWVCVFHMRMSQAVVSLGPLEEQQVVNC